MRSRGRFYNKNTEKSESDSSDKTKIISRDILIIEENIKTCYSWIKIVLFGRLP